MATIVLDIGGHLGESLDVILSPKFAIDRIHTFEPAARCISTLRKYSDPRLSVHPYALGRHSGTVLLYGTGSCAATLYGDKNTGSNVRTESVEVRDICQWMSENVSCSDRIHVKMNCEGAEADILARLEETGYLTCIDSLLLSLDVLKIPSLAHRKDEVIAALTTHGVRYTIRSKSAPRAVHEWLTREAARDSVSRWEQVRWFLGGPLPFARKVRRGLQLITPRPVWLWAAKRYGPSGR